MEKFIERSAEGTQERQRLSVSGILDVEKLTGERTPLVRLYERWRDNSDLRGFSWIDVTADNPFNFVLHNHRGTFIGGLSNLVLNEYPFQMQVRSCAAEYWECKTEAQPVAHYVNQELDGRQREYVRLMIPITGAYGKVAKIVYAYRHFKPPSPSFDSPDE